MGLFDFLGRGDQTTTSTTRAPTHGEGSTYERKTDAPVVKETVRDEYQHNVRQNVQVEHDRTEYIKTVQPLKEHQVNRTDVTTKQRADQYREVDADSGATRDAADKLRQHREKIASQGGSTHVEGKHRYVEQAPQVSHTDRRHVIEEVQPVIEREVVRPHVVEEKQNIFVHKKEAPVLHETRVLPAMSKEEFDRSNSGRGGYQTTTSQRNTTTTAQRGSQRPTTKEEARRVFDDRIAESLAETGEYRQTGVWLVRV
jgi:hypothetical protein